MNNYFLIFSFLTAANAGLGCCSPFTVSIIVYIIQGKEHTILTERWPCTFAHKHESHKYVENLYNSPA